MSNSMYRLDLSAYSLRDLLELNEGDVISDKELAIEMTMRGLKPQILKAKKRDSLAVREE